LPRAFDGSRRGVPHEALHREGSRIHGEKLVNRSITSRQKNVQTTSKTLDMLLSKNAKL
jgi:hypothetical protein